MSRALRLLAAGAALTLIALLFDAAPLLVPGLALPLLAVASSTWVVAAARGAGIERRGLPARILEGETLAAELACSSGPLGLPGAAVIDPLESEQRRTPRRGLHRIPPPMLLLADPFGIASASVIGAGGEQQLLVLPRTEPIVSPSDGERRLAGARRPGAGAEPFGAVDVEGLRPYSPGTPASRIHWPALARGRGLLERHLEADGEQLPLVALDTRGEATRDQLDAAVRAAASLMLALARAGGCRALLPGDRRAVTLAPDLLAWEAVHARLALVEGGPDARAPELGARPAYGGLIYVALRPAVRPPGGARGCVLVLPASLSPPSARSLFEVAGCRGFATGAQSAARTRAA